MAEELISGYVDRAAFKADTDFIIDNLKRALETYAGLKEVKIELKGSAALKDFSAAAKQTQAEMAELRKRNLELNNTIKEFVLRQKEAKAATDAVTKSTKDGAKATKDAERAKAAEAKLMSQASDEYFQLNKALIDAEKRYKNLALTVGLNNDATKAALKEAVSIRKVLNEIDQNLGNYQRNVGNYASAYNGLGASLQNILREAPSAAVSLNTFFLAISNNLPMLFDEIVKIQKAQKESILVAKEAAVAAKLQAEAEAIAAGANKEAAIQAGILAEKQALANVEQTKAPSLLKQLGSSLFSVNTLLTVSVLALTLFGGKLIDYISNLGKGKKAIDEFKETQKTLNEVWVESAKEAGKELGSLKVLQAQIEATNVPMEKRLQAVKDLKEEYPEYFKGLTNEQILTGNVGNAYDAAAQAILRKARANAAAAEIEKLSSKNLEIEIKSQLAAIEANDKIRKAKADVTVSGGGSAPGLGSNFGGASRQAKQQAILENFNQQKAADQAELELNNKKINLLLKNVADGADATIKIDKEKNAKQAAITKQSVKELLDAAFEIYKIDQNRKIRLLADELNNEKLSYDQRIAVLQDLSTAKLELIGREKQNEIRLENDKLAAINANLKTAKGTERENLIVEKKNTQERLKIIDAKFADDTRKILEENEKSFTELTAKEQARRLKLQKENSEAFLKMLGEEKDKEKALIEQQYATAQKALIDRLNKKAISEQEYQDKSLRLTFELQQKGLEAEIKYAKQLLLVKQALGMDVSKEAAKIAQLELDLSKLTLDQRMKDEQKKRDEIKKTFDTIRDYTTNVMGVIEGALEAITTKQKNDIRDQLDAVEKKTAREIELVNASTATEEEKAARIAIINSRATAEKEALARKERQIEIEKARFKKAQTLFNIALDIAEALATLNFFKAAIATAQFAIAAATPIPRYFRGKGKADMYEGPAFVNDNPDGFTREVIERADGSLEFPTGRNVITNIGRGDVVHPDADAFIRSAFAVAHGGAIVKKSQSGGSEGEVLGEIKKHSKYLQAIANKPTQQIHGSEKGLVNLLHWGSNQVSYVQDNLQY